MMNHFFGDILEEVWGAVGPVEAAAEVDRGYHHAHGDDGCQAEDQDKWYFSWKTQLYYN